MFLGTHPFRLDEKARLVLPARFREQLAGGLVMARGQERCVYAFPTAEFERVHEQLRRAPLTSKQSRDHLRVLLSGASDEVPDRQGRVVVPAVLRAWAGLDRDCVAIGAGARVELWDASAWATYLAGQEDAYAAAGADQVAGADGGGEGAGAAT